jgi:LysM repeat protein
MIMVPQQRLIRIVILVLLTGLLLVACERPLPGSSTETPTADPGSSVITDENVGGGTPNEAAPGSEEPAADTSTDTAADSNIDPATDSSTDTTAASSSDTPREEDSSDTATDDTTAPATEGYPAPADDTSVEEAPAAEANDTATDAATTDAAAAPATDTNTEAASGTTTTDTTTTTDATAATTTEARPASHIVAAGENLYRIGLKYGISWVTLAQHNGLTNANRIVVGQELKIPSDTTTTAPTPTPSPQTEEVYTVKAGDTLFSIGQAYGLSWTQIAEANGIVNPNQIAAGQSLKIPVDKPSPTQQSFVHTVQAGETLFIISLRYGVAWPAIAEANKLETPYVIFPGQTLIIPGK